MRHRSVTALLVATAWLCQLSAASRAESPLSVERPTPHEWIVKSGTQTLCDYVFAPDQIKPYVRELAPLRGDNLLRDSPFDHKHHHGLMFAIRVNGVNFWEETPGCGHEKSVGTATSEIGTSRGGHPRALLRHRIHWVAEPECEAREYREGRPADRGPHPLGDPRRVFR